MIKPLTEFNIGDITVLYNAGLIGLVGKGDGTINLYDNIYKEIKVNKYIVNPHAMQVLYIVATELQTECKSKNEKIKRNYEDEIKRNDIAIKYYDNILNKIQSMENLL